MQLLYDADCGFCTRSASWLSAWGVPGVRSLQSVDLPALGVDAERASREIPAVLRSGRVVYGASAIGHALGAGPAWCRVVGWLVRGPLLWPSSALYRVVARYRYRLPGGSAACRLAD